MLRNIEFKFHYPPTIFGMYDTGEGIIYIFGNMNENLIEELISHETLHFVIQKIEGKMASLLLDNINSEELI